MRQRSFVVAGRRLSRDFWVCLAHSGAGSTTSFYFLPGQTGRPLPKVQSHCSANCRDARAVNREARPSAFGRVRTSPCPAILPLAARCVALYVYKNELYFYRLQILARVH